MIRGTSTARPAILLLVVLALASCGGEDRSPAGLPTGSLVIETGGEEVEVAVEIAETPETRTRGLMGRTELAPDAGMVFLGEEPSEGAFWMKGTLIPLSVAFWDSDDTIQAILDMEPCREDPCHLYNPGVRWIGAVEVNQGFFEQHGIAPGARVRLER